MRVLVHLLGLSLATYGFSDPKSGFLAHNNLRKLHGVEDLVYDKELEKYAQAHCNWMVDNNKFEHALNLGELQQGENLYQLTAPSKAIAQKVLNYTNAVQAWYDEIKDYDFDRPGYSSATGHFTQVVWKSSTKVGMAHSFTEDGKLFITARYSPAGNFNTPESFEKNVPKPLRADANAKLSALGIGLLLLTAL